MKRIRAGVLTGLYLFFSCSQIFSQTQSATYQLNRIEPYQLAITFLKTTHLIFPYAITSVDRGRPDILAQKAKGVENVLLVKAGRENFKESNLSVITADGKFYSFLVNYSATPLSLALSFTNITNPPASGPLLLAGRSEAIIQRQAEWIASQKKAFPALKDYKYKVQLQLKGLYIQEEVIFYQMEIKNCSYINYDIAMLRFFIRDAKRSKRTASQELEIQPLYIHGDANQVKGQAKQVLVFALPKFTIPDKKYLTIQLLEKNGGRHLQLNVQNSTIVKARYIGK